jgi:hypothetical protein
LTPPGNISPGRPALSVGSTIRNALPFCSDSEEKRHGSHS